MSKPICVFRVDASTKIGTGHLMRCLVLAHSLQPHYEIRFICRQHDVAYESFFENNEYAIHVLHHTSDVAFDNQKPYLDWLGTSEKIDALDTVAILRQWPNRVHWIVVDHYALSSEWETCCVAYGNHVMAIDDLANRRHACDILLDQNYHPQPLKRYQGLIPNTCHTLFGVNSVLMRHEFVESRARVRIREAMQCILVTFGGIDFHDETSKVLESLEPYPFMVHVVVGLFHPSKDKIERYCQAMQNWHFHCQTKKIHELMLAADCAIGAGGTALWERMALGLPSIVSSIADNQTPGLKALQEQNLVVYLGRADNLKAADYQLAVNDLVKNINKLQQLSSDGLKLIDAKGASRVCQEMLEFEHKER